MARYVYDKKHKAFVPRRLGVKSLVFAVLRYLIAVVFVAVLFYLVFAMVFSTDREMLLRKENKLLEAQLDSLDRRLYAVELAVENLRIRDRKIYNDLFSSDPPNYIVEARDTLIRNWEDFEKVGESDLVWDAFAMASRAEIRARQVSEWLSDIESVFGSDDFEPSSIPSIVPLANFSPLQTGASVGKKVNPFYKTVHDHQGIDLLAPVGTPVRCSADGKVARTTKTEKGMGNTVVVEHPGGFRTVYSHLKSISVSEGQKVGQGQQIGEVGQSGTTFAPCLHYEVLRGGVRQDPLNYFFAELDPSAYRDMTIVALTTGQSMD